MTKQPKLLYAALGRDGQTPVAGKYINLNSKEPCVDYIPLFAAACPDGKSIPMFRGPAIENIKNRGTYGRFFVASRASTHNLGYEHAVILCILFFPEQCDDVNLRPRVMTWMLPSLEKRKY